MSKNNKRDYFIDMMRGLMLVIMALDHTPFFTKRYTYQTFGFFGAAIGFIFLSGYVFGFVYSRYLNDPSTLKIKTYRRIWLIYKYHIALFILMLLINFVSTILMNGEPVQAVVSEIWSNPVSLIKFLLLLNQPDGFDILPLYIILLAVSPFVLLAFKNGRAKLILGISFLVWLSIQIPFIQNSFESLQAGLGVDIGFFNVFAWQFLFFIGQYLGFNRFNNIRIIPYNKALLWTSFIILFIVCIIRQVGYSKGWELVYTLINERTYLIAPRLVNFLIMVYFIGGIYKYFRVTQINYLAFLGQYSIDVFAFHIPLTFLMYSNSEFLAGFNKPIQVLLAGILIVLLVIPAIIKAELKDKSRENRSQRLAGSLSLIVRFPKDLFIILTNPFFRKRELD